MNQLIMFVDYHSYGGTYMFFLYVNLLGCSSEKIQIADLSTEQRKICAEAIKNFERSQMPEIQQCLYDGMKIHPNLSGTLNTVVNIIDGKYSIVGESENTFNTKSVVECMHQNIKDWKMEYPTEGTEGAVINCNKEHHEIPFSFKKSGN